jgi:hypothetical protein
MFGQENQRRAMCSCRSGVHTLTITMKATTPKSAIRAMRCAHARSSPSVFMTSHVAPSIT